MHELAITQSVVEAVTGRVGDARVIRIRLRVGRLSGVLPDAMRFCFEVVAAGTSLAGAELLIDEPEGTARCRSCGTDFTVADAILLCPCQSADVEVLTGRELAIASVELAEKDLVETDPV